MSFCILALVITGCIRDPIPYDFSDDIDLLVADTLVYDIRSLTYQTPPEMGGYPSLYFGKDSAGYNCRFSMINIAKYSQDYSVLLMELTDTTTIVSLDSVFLVLTAKDTNLAISTAVYNLVNFPTGGSADSLFDEYTSNYLNLDTTRIVTGFGTPLASTVLQSDTATTYPYLKFDLSDALEFLTYFSDTSATAHNRSFAVWKDEDGSGITEFFSRNAGSYRPRLQVHYLRSTEDDEYGNPILDTLTKSFYPDADLTVIYPPALTVDDTTNITVGSAKGLKSILTVGFADTSLPESAIIRSAKLTLWPAAGSADDGDPTIGIYSIDTTVIEDDRYYPVDPYEKLVDLADPTFSDGKVEFELRTLLQAVVLKQAGNYGLKLYSTSANDPFRTFSFHPATGDTLYATPSLRILYVIP
ncbi:MAG: hypothetical protein ABIA75_05225 [Candidatus Neomarinimicrobiota bacterium]